MFINLTFVIDTSEIDYIWFYADIAGAFFNNTSKWKSCISDHMWVCFFNKGSTLLHLLMCPIYTLERVSWIGGHNEELRVSQNQLYPYGLFPFQVCNLILDGHTKYTVKKTHICFWNINGWIFLSVPSLKQPPNFNHTVLASSLAIPLLLLYHNSVIN